MKHLYLIALVIVFCGCAKKTPTKLSDDVINIKLNAKPQSYLMFSDFIKDSKIIKVKSDKYLIGEYKKIIFYKDYLYVSDNIQTKSIYKIDTLGNICGVISRLGKGPGEYFSLQDFCIDKSKDQIIMYDALLRKLLFFNLNGDFLEEHLIPNVVAEEITIMDNGELLLYSSFNSNKIGKRKKVTGIIKYNPNSQNLSEFFSLKEKSTGVKDKSLTGHSKNIILTPLYESRVYRCVDNKMQLELELANNNSSNTDIMEAYGNNKYYLLLIRQENDGCYVIYNKKTMSLKDGKGIINDIFGLQPNAFSICDDFLISQIPVENIIYFNRYENYISNLGVSENAIKKAQSIKKSLNITPNDNQLIIISKLK